VANPPIYAYRNGVIVQDADYVLVVDDVGNTEGSVAVPDDDGPLCPDAAALVLPHADGAEDRPDYARAARGWPENRANRASADCPTSSNGILPGLQAAYLTLVKNLTIF